MLAGRRLGEVGDGGGGGRTGDRSSKMAAKRKEGLGVTGTKNNSDGDA